MNLTILGYWAGFPLNGGACSSYMLTVDKKHLLIDVGSGSISNFSKIASYHNIIGIILSHWHNDHVADLRTYEHAWKVLMDQNIVDFKLPIYAPYDDINQWTNYNEEVLDLHMIEAGAEFIIDSFEVQTFGVQHTVPCFGLRVAHQNRVFVYTSDTQYFQELPQLVANCDLLVTEITNIPGSRHSSGKGHMSPDEALSLVQDNQVKKIILSHLPSDIQIESLKASLKAHQDKNWFLASDILTIVL